MKDEAWKWQQAPVKTQWGYDMVVADLAIDKDHTVSVYCERDQIAKVEALFTSPAQRKPLTDEQIMEMYNEPRSDAEMIAFARAIEVAHGIGEQK